MISAKTAARLLTALASQDSGNEVLSQLNNAAFALPAVIVAAHVSTTTDFAALAIGDLVVHIPATAGSASFSKVIASGTLPAAAVVGDLYIAIRSAANAVASSVKL